VAYEAQRGEKQLVVVDGVEGKEYELFWKSRLVFDSPSQVHALAVWGDEFLRVEAEIGMPPAKPSAAARVPILPSSPPASENAQAREGSQIEAVQHFQRGAALYQKGDLNAAMVDMREAIRLAPDFAEAHANLANCLDT
jgi:tetratricopeptide (TPR) repeat protein